jgi:hypothetical protein
VIDVTPSYPAAFHVVLDVATHEGRGVSDHHRKGRHLDMENDTEEQPSSDDDRPGLRQRLHAATGDRDAEAEAVADRAAEAGTLVDVDDAKVAVQRSHGEAGAGEPRPVTSHPDEELAETSDAEAVARESAGDDQPA